MSNEILIKALSYIARTDGGSVELNAKSCYLLAKTALEEYAAQQERAADGATYCPEHGNMGFLTTCSVCGIATTPRR